MNRNTDWITVAAISLLIFTITLTAPALPNAMTATAGDAMHAQVEVVDASGKGTLHDADATERYHLANAQYDYTFGATGLLSIANRKAAVTVSVSDTPYAPVALTIERNGKREEPALASLPTRMRVIGSPSPTAVEYTWGTPETVQLTLRIEVVPNEPELTRWRIVALSPSPGGKITRMRLPVLRNVTIGKEATDDWFVAPGYERHGAGAYYNTTVTGNNGVPPRMGMAINWASCFDRSSGSGLGLFLDTPQDEDVDVLTARDVGERHVNVRDSTSTSEVATPEVGGLRVSFEFPHIPDQIPIAYVVVHVGDWHRVADHFRTLVGAREPVPSNPAWVQDLDAWALAGFRDRGLTFNSLPSQYRTAAKDGARLLNVYDASCDGAWVSCGVYPYPNPYYGTEEELREAVTRVRDLGGHTIFYLNYQLTIPFGPSVKRIGPVPVAMIPTGIPLPFLPPGMTPVTNRATVGYASDEFVAGRGLRAWSDRNLYWALHYATHYGADGIYWDQLSCCPGALKETAWNLARMTAECRKIVPGFITAGEGVGMAHGRNLTLGLSSAVFHHTEFYRYTFPSHLVIDGTANSANRWRDKRYENERFNAIFLDGSRFDGLPPDKIFADNTMALRQRTKQLLYPATFRDTEGVSLTFPDGIKNREPTWE